MAQNGALKVPVIGVASSKWSVEQWRTRARESIKYISAAKSSTRICWGNLLLRCNTTAETTRTLPPSMRCDSSCTVRMPSVLSGDPTCVVRHRHPRLSSLRPAEGWRVIVEKPFGRDLASARQLNRIAHAAFSEDSILRIDHFLAKEAIMNILYFRFANSFLEPLGTVTTWTACRSRWPRVSAWRVAGRSMKLPVVCATSCRTICSRSSRCWRWNRR